MKLQVGPDAAGGAPGDAGDAGPAAGSRRTILAACALIALATLAAYHDTFSVPFLLDDVESIANNASIRRLWPLGPVLTQPRGDNPAAGRPLFNLTLALNYFAGGTEVRGYHALNLLIHVLAALALFGLVRRTLLLPALRGRFGGAALPLALAASLLWAVHPLQTRAVIYLSQRAELLMGLCYLLTLYCFVRGLPAAASGAWRVLAVLACLAGMGAKEVMVSAPLLALLYDRTFAAGSFRAALRRRWPLYLGLAAAWPLLGCLVAGKIGGAGAADFVAGIVGGEYARAQPAAIVHYLRLSLWPHPLVFDYGASSPAAGAGAAAAPALILALLAAGTLIGLWRRRGVGFLGAGFLGLLAPSSSVVPIAPELLAESRMYLPLAPIVLLVVLSVHAAVPRLGRWVFPGLTVALALLTVARTADYRSARTIWSDTVARRPGNPRAHNNLGLALMEDGETQAALAQFSQALALEPDYGPAADNLGIALVRLGRYDEAIAHFQSVLVSRPDSAQTEVGLGFAHWRAGRGEEAIAHLRRAQGIDPRSATAALHLGNALIARGETDEAIAQWRRAVAVRPELAEAHNNLAVALLQRGRADEAIAHLRRALEIRPDDAEARGNLRSLAWVLATSPEAAERDGAKAVELARELNRLSGGGAPPDLATLAAACAEAGRFDEAVATAEQALQLALAHNDAPLVEAIGAHLERYRARSPLHIAGQRPAAVVPD